MVKSSKILVQSSSISMMAWIHLFLMLLSCQSVVRGQGSSTNQAKAQAAIDEFNRRAELIANTAMRALFDFYVNMTAHNRAIFDKHHQVYKVYQLETARKMSRFNTANFPDELKRAIKIVAHLGEAAQTDPVKVKRLTDVKGKMTTIYGKAEVCLAGYTKCLKRDPDLNHLFKTSRNPSLLLKAWKGFRDATGKKFKNDYEEYVSLSNEAYAISGFADTGEGWRDRFEMVNMEAEMDKLYEKILPFYEKLHAYVRNKLKKIYGADKFPKTGHIPVHLLGDPLGQSWEHIEKDLVPYDDVVPIDITPELVRQNYNGKKMFRTAEKFFTSLGLEKMTQKFWAKSMMERPKDNRSVSCWPKTGDMYDKAKDDFRLQQCVTPNQYHFQTAHHEMGHIVNFMAYRNLPFVFRYSPLSVFRSTGYIHPSNEIGTGRVEGFHEAVGDTIALSVLTPDHLRKLNLLGQPKKNHNQKKADINYLMVTALNKLVLLRYAYLIDKWRWSVFKGTTKPADYNKYWWRLRCKYQGVSPPVKRQSSDFDIGALYHIPQGTDYIRYFVGLIAQFQFHKALCDTAKYKGPLHHCNIYGSKAAGTALKNMMALGRSKSWRDTLQQLTGQRKLDVQPFLDYFKPLIDFLDKQKLTDVGWKQSCPVDCEKPNKPKT